MDLDTNAESNLTPTINTNNSDSNANNILLTTNGATSNGQQPNNNNNNNNTSNNNGSSAAATLMTSFGRMKSRYDTDVIRLIGQHLISLGLKQTVEQLLEESGLNGFDHPLAAKLQQYILLGDWDNAGLLVEEIVNYTEGDRRSNMQEMRLILAEQKFLELIEDNQHIKALKCLRLEITPLIDDMKHIQHLTTLLMSKSIDEVKLRANWLGKGNQSRQLLVERFQRFIPPLMMLPPKRLSTLLSQANQLQREKCSLHIPSSNDSLSEYIDLKSDHICSPDKFPLTSRQELDSHKTEVWYCKFSNDGKKLATAGLGGKIKIWSLNKSTKLLDEITTLECHSHSITCLSWSPNDLFLLACGSEDKADLWIWDVVKEESKPIVHSDEESITTCSWHLSGTKFAAASMKGNFNIYDTDGNRCGGREGVRVQCLSFLNQDSDYILAADSLNRIKSYAIRDMSLETDEEDILEERHPIMSFIIDKLDKYIAINLVDQGVHLWDYRLKTLLRMFPGVCQRNFTIYSTFSSQHSSFLASGSEDGKVYIYNLHKDEPVAVLHGHSRCVSCVTWNPRYPEFLVSVSDDRVVRLWGPDKSRVKG